MFLNSDSTVKMFLSAVSPVTMFLSADSPVTMLLSADSPVKSLLSVDSTATSSLSLDLPDSLDTEMRSVARSTQKEEEGMFLLLPRTVLLQKLSWTNLPKFLKLRCVCVLDRVSRANLLHRKMVKD